MKLTLVLVLCIVFAGSNAAARQASKLPAPDKIVGDYVKALGGKKRVTAVRDATYEWTYKRGDNGESGTARTRTKAPASARTDVFTPAGEIGAAANGRSAWARGTDGHLLTLTDSAALSAKLHAMIDATRLVEYKKQGVLARTAGLENIYGQPSVVVEFSSRAGARLRYWFNTETKLLVRMTDDARGLTVRYENWQPRAGSPLRLEPHRLLFEERRVWQIMLTLTEARYNEGLSDVLFDPPGDASLDIPALLRDLERNQIEVDRRINEYTFTRKVTERELNDRGELKKEKVNVYEVYPFLGAGWIQKHLSENGVPLSAEQAAKEEKRVAEQMLRAERNQPLFEASLAKARARREAEQKKGVEEKHDGDDVSIKTFLRACELISPRRERFRERDTIVFDFRPRPGFRPKSRGETIVSKLAGIIWIDPAEKQVMRLEARLVEGFRMGGGLVASIKPGAAFAFEQTRLADGVWLPRFSQVNASARVFLFAGMTINETNEFSDYKRFSTKAGEDKLDAPKQEKPEEPKEPKEP
ncbi:MAG: hypothetical protein LC802_11100 [Acidobacteria bacterium]|nr:hypothetical protein [Acidobacteriota bacterium]